MRAAPGVRREKIAGTVAGSTAQQDVGWQLGNNDEAVGVDLWTWSLVGTGDADADRQALAELRGILSDDECRRADRFKADRHRDQYIRGRGRLRQILADYMQQAPGVVVFRYGARDKPYVAAPGPHFNLSHTDDFAALAVCAECEVGIDVERIRPIERDIAERYFSAAEVEALGRVDDDDWFDAFYRIWTAKEAVIKALGEGLSLGLDRFSVPVGRDDPEGVRFHGDGIAAQRWALARLRPSAGIVGCVAIERAGPILINTRAWPP